MGELVDFHPVLAGKSFLANPAGKWLLTGVRPLMDFKLVVARETSPADWTLERLLPRVGSLVQLEFIIT